MTNKPVFKIILVVLVIGLVAFIYFKGKNNPAVLIEKDRKMGGTDLSPQTEFNFQQYLDSSTEELNDTQKTNLADLKEKFKTAEDTVLYLNLARFWDSSKYYGIAGYYFQKIAESNSTEDNWNRSGEKYFEAQKVTSDSTQFKYLSDHSINAFEKVLEINPANLDVKADLAVSYIEGRGDVMKGVGLLKEIEQVDPDNQKALFYLGILSIQSNQLEKALERFQHLVELQPKNPFHYFYLARIYLAMNNKEKALEALKKYKSLLKDEKLKEEADQAIKQLSNS